MKKKLNKIFLINDFLLSVNESSENIFISRRVAFIIIFLKLFFTKKKEKNALFSIKNVNGAKKLKDF